MGIMKGVEENVVRGAGIRGVCPRKPWHTVVHRLQKAALALLLQGLGCSAPRRHGAQERGDITSTA